MSKILLTIITCVYIIASTFITIKKEDEMFFIYAIAIGAMLLGMVGAFL